MGIFDALNTSVGGLQAQSFALQNISGNIANASTTGYKGIDTSFEDLIPDSTTPSRQVAGGVTAFAQQTITTQGTVSATSVATNMAINGDGFFSVQAATGVVDNVPVFSGVTDYTRRGDFQVNANGNLVNGAGYYLMGVDVDPKTGNPTGNVAHVLQFQNNFIPAQATSAIQYAANLPTEPKTVASSSASAGTLTADGGLNPADFASNPLPVGTPAAPFTDNTLTGTGVMNQAATPAPITATTALSGTAPSNSLPTSFANGDTLTVDGTTIHFVTTGTNLAAVPPVIDITDNVGTLMTAIGNITGTAPTISATTGAITLHTGTAQNLQHQQLVARVFRARLLVTRHCCPRWRRYGRHRRGHRQRHHHFHQRIDLRRCGDCLQCRRHPGEPAIALGQDRQLRARRRSPGRLESVLPDQHHRHGCADRMGQRRH